MFRTKLVLAILIFAHIFISCDVQQGIPPFVENNYGSLIIQEGSGKSALILLNQKLLDQKTPVTLNNLQPGIYEIILLADNLIQGETKIVEVLNGELNTVNVDLKSGVTADVTIESSPSKMPAYWNGNYLGTTPLNVEGVPVGIGTFKVASGNWRSEESLNLKQGNNLLQLKAAPEPSILLEYISNTSCLSCPEIDDIIEKVKENLDDDRLQRLSWHAYYPNPSDPIFLYLPEPQRVRHDFFNPRALPALYLNGNTIDVINRDELNQNLLRSIEESMNQEALCAVRVEDFSKTINGWNGELVLTAFGTIKKPSFDLVVREMSWDALEPPGSNGQSFFSELIRADAVFEKNPPNQISQGSETKYRFTFSDEMLNLLRFSDLELVFWLESREGAPSILCSGKHPFVFSN